MADYGWKAENCVFDYRPVAVSNMSTFPSYDPETDSIHLNGNSVIMLTLLMKAKFGEKFDDEVIFHEKVAGLIRQLEQAAGMTPRPADCFSPWDLHEFSKGVYCNSFQNGWWSMDEEQRVQYLQDAAAPWVFTADQIESVIEGIDNLLFRSRQIVEQVDSTNNQ